jgi:hypothetical protein
MEERMITATKRPEVETPRRIFLVLSSHSLPYARHTLQSLLQNALEPLYLSLITDSTADRDMLIEEVQKLPGAGRHSWKVLAAEDLKDFETETFAHYPNLRLLRQGHPCWRKVSDPVLLTQPGEEIVVIDPDVYFPNRFRFEPTPDRGLLLMWQRPNCLFPPEVVETALNAGISLARHVDIGVAHWRAPVDLDWLDWLIGKLGGSRLPKLMHIEAIIWAALAARIGGGHLNHNLWRCWRRSQTKRVLLKAGIAGPQILRSEPWTQIKCFHAGGEAKYWLAEACRRGWTRGTDRIDRSLPTRPFILLTPAQYKYEQRIKGYLRKCGYYRLFSPRGEAQSPTVDA